MQPPQPPHGGHPPGYGPPSGPPGPPMPPGPPGWRPPGPQPPNTNPAVVIIALLGALVLLIGAGAVVRWWFVAHKSSKQASVTPTIPDLPPPPTYSPPTFNPPTFNPRSFSPPTVPSIPVPTYSPPPMNYGAIAVAPNGAVGRAWDYKSAAAARQRALKACPASGCKVLTTFVNGCGAVAYNPKTNRYWGGSGATRAAAQKDAISNAGGGRTITWVCTTRYSR